MICEPLPIDSKSSTVLAATVFPQIFDNKQQEENLQCEAQQPYPPLELEYCGLQWRIHDFCKGDTVLFLPPLPSLSLPVPPSLHCPFTPLPCLLPSHHVFCVELRTVEALRPCTSVGNFIL